MTPHEKAARAAGWVPAPHDISGVLQRPVTEKERANGAPGLQWFAHSWEMACELDGLEVAVQLTTSDIGFAIRDFLEGAEIHRSEGDDAAECASVDVSDVNNPIIWLENGQRFQIRIFAMGDQP